MLFAKQQNSSHVVYIGLHVLKEKKTLPPAIYPLGDVISSREWNRH